MIAPRARIPNTSGMTLTDIVSAAAKPTPNATRDANAPRAEATAEEPDEARDLDAKAHADRRLRAEPVGDGAPGKAADGRSDAVRGEGERGDGQAQALVADERHRVDGEHEREARPGASHEAFRYHWRGSASACARWRPSPRRRARAARPGRAVQPARRDPPSRGDRTVSAASIESAPQPLPIERIGRAPAEQLDQPGREGARGDIAEVEPDEDQCQGEAAPRVEPPRDRRRAQQVEARHADPAEQARRGDRAARARRPRKRGRRRSRPGSPSPRGSGGGRSGRRAHPHAKPATPPTSRFIDSAAEMAPRLHPKRSARKGRKTP